MSKLICRRITVHFTVTQSCRMSFLTRSSQSRRCRNWSFPDSCVKNSWSKICWSSSCIEIGWVSSMAPIHSVLWLMRQSFLYNLSISCSLRFMRNLIINLCWLLIIRMDTRRRFPGCAGHLSGMRSVNTRSHFNILGPTTGWLSSLDSGCAWLI